MKLFTTIAAAALTIGSVAAPAANAGMAYPYAAGQKFCDLRDMGADQESAMNAAIHKGFNPRKTAVFVNINGKPVDEGLLTFSRFIAEQCPQHLR